MTPFIRNQKPKQLLIKVDMMMYLNQSLVLLHQTYKDLYEKAQAGLLIQSQIIILIPQSITL